MLRWPLLILLGVGLMLPALILGPGATHSAIYNLTWTAEISDALRAGEAYPRWLHGAFAGLGSPTFYFYPPMAHWLAGLIGLIAPTATAVTLTGGLLLIASGLSMYAFLARIGARPLLGASLYMAAPYHLMDLYVRGALAEFAAFVWLPLIALALVSLPKRWATLLLAVSVAGLLLSHLPMTILTGAFLIAPLAAWRAWQDRAVVLPGLVAGVLGLALAAFYLLPALTLQSHISEGLLWGEFYQPKSWSIWAKHDVRYLASLPAIAVGMALLSLGSRTVWRVVAVVSAVAVLGVIPWMWDLPLLSKTQFPWRLLCVVEFAAIAALALKPPPLGALVGGVFVILLSYVAQAHEYSWVLKRAGPPAQAVALRQDAPEYLPPGFDVSEVSARQRLVSLQRYDDIAPVTDAIVVNHAGRVTLRRNAFPIWRVEKDGVEAISRGPLITFDATPGVYRVRRVIIWQEWLGALISLLAVAALSAFGARIMTRRDAMAAHGS